MASLTVSIIVDPHCGSRLQEIAEHGPVWIAATKVNRAAAERFWRERSAPEGNDGVTTFQIDAQQSPTEWCREILSVVEEHLGAYDGHQPTYDSIEIYGTPAAQELVSLLSHNGYVHIVERIDGFCASRIVAAL